MGVLVGLEFFGVKYEWWLQVLAAALLVASVSLHDAADDAADRLALRLCAECVGMIVQVCQPKEARPSLG